MKTRLIKTTVAVVVASAVVIGVWYFRSPESTFVKVGRPAPDLELPSLGLEGPTTRLSSFRGRPVLLVLFMAGCHICETQAWGIERLHREYLHKGLVVVGVSVDRTPAITADFISRHELTHFVLFDNNGATVGRVFRSHKMPEAYLIDANGIVRAVFLGRVEWRAQEIREQIEKLLPAGRRLPG